MSTAKATDSQTSDVPRLARFDLLAIGGAFLVLLAIGVDFLWSGDDAQRLIGVVLVALAFALLAVGRMLWDIALRLESSDDRRA